MTLRRLCTGSILAALLWSVTAGAVTATDGRGREVSLPGHAGRIVSLAPHLTELLFAAGAGDRTVAAVSYSDYPPAARELPRVGDAAQIDMERVVAMAPDLVVAWKGGNSAGDIVQLERLGLRVYVAESATLAGIAGQLETLGRLAGTSQAARPAAERYRQSLAALRRRYAGRPTVTLFYQIWDRPLMTVSGRHFINDAIELCGGRNPFAAVEAMVPSVSREAVIAADPLALVANDAGGEGGDVLGEWRRWSTLRAVRQGNLFTIPSDMIARPTPRILNGVRRLCEALDEAREGGKQGTDNR